MSAYDVNTFRKNITLILEQNKNLVFFAFNINMLQSFKTLIKIPFVFSQGSRLISKVWKEILGFPPLAICSLFLPLLQSEIPQS